MKEENKTIRNFKLTSWAIKNKNTVYLAIVLLLFFGIFSYSSLSKELFPEINFPTVFVSVVYPGNSPSDIENMVTNPLEKELKTLKDVNQIKSISVQDAAMIFVEYKANIDIDDVFQDVKDVVDRSRSELPDDLPTDPQVIEFTFASFPVVTINLSGDYNIDELKEYADYLIDELETISEVSSVDLQGISEKEVQVNLDVHKLQELNISFREISNAIKFENITMSAGDIEMDNVNRNIRIIGEFTDVEQIANIIIKSTDNKIVHLKDIAEVKETYTDATSKSRLWNQPVVSLQIVKENGENVIECVQKSFDKIAEAQQAGKIPQDLRITVTNDQAHNVKMLLHNLENNLIMGVILVVLILLFFLGLRNAVLVGFSIPMSMFMSFAVLNLLGETVNMITLFSMILALGMLVDNAIVVVENIYRYAANGEKLKDATLKATSEVAVPIIASTLTTLAAFFPLVFWNDMMGEFMKLMPVTLIIVLSSSLFNALVFTPVLSNVLIKTSDQIRKPQKKKSLIWIGVLLALSIPLYVLQKYTPANILVIVAVLILLYSFVLFDLSIWTQQKFLVWLENIYLRFIKYSLKGKKPMIFMIGMFLLLFFTMIFYFGIKKPKVILFPNNEPQYLSLTATLPSGTTLEYTDSIMSIIETDFDQQMEPYKDIIKSKLVNIGKGVKTDGFSMGNKLNQGQIVVRFVGFDDRHGINTSEIQMQLSEHFKNRYPGIKFIIEKNKMGPPTGKAVNIELSGDDMGQLIAYSDSIISMVDKAKIPGIEQMEVDIETDKPELLITVDKEKAGRFGLTTLQIASTIRNAIFGNEVSKLKAGDEEYPIMVRFSKEYRNNISALLNQKITLHKGREVVEIPISAVTKLEMSNSYSSIRHIDKVKTLTLSSNVLEGYNANDINKIVQATLSSLKLPEGYAISFTGEQKNMASSMKFLKSAMFIAIALIIIILVTQFNSIAKPLIIGASVLFSTIGVFGGLATFDMNFVIMMTGIGIISLAGIVVNNAIVLIDYIDFLKTDRKKELGIEPEGNLPIDEIKNCIVEAGKTRLRPVLLTAITTILGLISLAIGLNFNFGGFLSKFQPNIYLGGDTVTFWGPMAWTIIFGLAFATFMTLIIVPVMYLIGNQIKIRFTKK